MSSGRKIFGILAVICCALSAQSAHARDYYFFNKAGVSRELYLADRIKCEELSGGAQRRRSDMTAVNTQLWQNPNLSAGQAAVAAGIASFMMAFVAARERRHLLLQVERICLADKGYRRFEMDKAAYWAIEKAPDAAMRIDQWFALASAVQPAGKEMHE